MRKAMLMAAGLGTRLRPFTELNPKPLLPVMGVPMAQYALDSLLEAGVQTVVANIHHLAAQARAGLSALDGAPGRLKISDESGKLLGSAGGLRRALPWLGEEPFFLLNSDVLCELDLDELANTHARLRSRLGTTVTLTVFPRGPAPGKYREILTDPASGRITGLGAHAAERPFFVGAAVIEPEAVRGLPEDVALEFVPEILLPAIQAGRAGFHAAAGLWFDIGSPELWLEAHIGLMQALEMGKLPPRWKARVTGLNRRLATQVWSSAAVSTKDSMPSSWVGPAYWHPGSESGPPPPFLGPRAVLYGGPPGGGRTPVESGIGHGGHWVSVRSS